MGTWANAEGNDGLFETTVTWTPPFSRARRERETALACEGWGHRTQLAFDLWHPPPREFFKRTVRPILITAAENKLLFTESIQRGMMGPRSVILLPPGFYPSYQLVSYVRPQHIYGYGSRILRSDGQ